MKHFIAIALFSLMTFSFLGDTGYLNFEEKPKMEVTQDLDGEQEEQEKSESDKFAALGDFLDLKTISVTLVLSVPLVTRLFAISYEVEIRPPRA